MILVNLSNFPWSPLARKKNQEIFTHMLRNSERFEKGLFLQPPIGRKSGDAQLEAASSLSISGKPVTVLQPIFSLSSTFGMAFGKDRPLRKSAATIAQLVVRKHCGDEPFLLWINSLAHFHGHLAEHLAPQAAFRVFDSAETLLMYERTADHERSNRQREILKLADAVLCANEQILTKLSHPVKQVFAGGTDFAAFQERQENFRLEPLFPKPVGKVYVGFTGTVSRKSLDIDLLHSLFTRFPAYLFLFAGSTHEPGLLGKLKSYPNFRFLPEPSPSDLASVIQGFDAAIVPHLDNESTRGTDFRTVLDYLACGIPVVSTSGPNVEQYGSPVYVVRSIWEFGNMLERVVTRTIKHDPAPGRELALEESWPIKIPVLMNWLLERLPTAG